MLKHHTHLEPAKRLTPKTVAPSQPSPLKGEADLTASRGGTRGGGEPWTHYGPDWPRFRLMQSGRKSGNDGLVWQSAHSYATGQRGPGSIVAFRELRYRVAMGGKLLILFRFVPFRPIPHPPDPHPPGFQPSLERRREPLLHADGRAIPGVERPSGVHRSGKLLILFRFVPFRSIPCRLRGPGAPSSQPSPLKGEGACPPSRERRALGA